MLRPLRKLHNLSDGLPPPYRNWLFRWIDRVLQRRLTNQRLSLWSHLKRATNECQPVFKSDRQQSHFLKGYRPFSAFKSRNLVDLAIGIEAHVGQVTNALPSRLSKSRKIQEKRDLPPLAGILAVYLFFIFILGVSGRWKTPKNLNCKASFVFANSILIGYFIFCAKLASKCIAL